ncbi:hypothetical protein BDW59DRAFT_149803 [Aspergillus cavernicola]|uniref:Nitrogen regulatory protein areA GATA-like domain-containing protein n=1 Tax=Aspergillus cavernicola TaxID=176166 RepID=A0ABR4I3A7_9EURO
MDPLPRGLVSTSGSVSAELGVIDAVDVGDIIQLWKAYSTNPSVHEGDTGYRLQNFFWRIWSNKRLSNTLTGSTLARLFLQVSEPSSLTMTPAKESGPPSSSLKLEKHSPGHGHPNSGSTTTTTTTTTTKQPLPPILKKKSNSSSHGETQKTTRLLLTGLGGESVTRKPSNPPTPIPPSRPVAFGDQGPRQSQKKTFVVASKAKGAKRRPMMMRRKSSQQSSVCSTRAHSPQSVSSPPPDVRTLEVQAVQEDEEADNEEAIEDPPDEPTSTTTTATQDQDQSSSPPPTISPPFLTNLKTLLHKKTPLPPLRPRTQTPLVGFFSSTSCRNFDVRHLSHENYAEEQPSTSNLVDTDFRARFAEQVRLAGEYEVYMAEGGGESGDEDGVREDGDKEEGEEDGGVSGPGAFGVEGEGVVQPGTSTTSTTLGTVSPSRFGDSQGATSTIATSFLESDGTDTFSSDGAEQPVAVAVPVAVPGPGPVPVPVSVPASTGNPHFLQTPPALSLPRGPGQLSLMIEHSRSLGSLSNETVNE